MGLDADSLGLFHVKPGSVSGVPPSGVDARRLVGLRVRRSLRGSPKALYLFTRTKSLQPLLEPGPCWPTCFSFTKWFGVWRMGVGTPDWSTVRGA